MQDRLSLTRVFSANTRLSLTLGWLAAITILLGSLVQWYVVTRLGLGVETDALFAATAVPQLILLVVTGSLMHVLVPLLATEDEESFRRGVWEIFIIVTGLFGALAIVLGLTAGYWVSWLVPGFTAAGKLLAVRLSRIQLGGMVFAAAASVQWSVYHARQRFVWAELSPVLANLGALLLLIWLLPRLGVIGAAWAIVLGAVLQVILLFPCLRPWRPPKWRSPTLGETWRRIRPILFGAAYYKTDPLVDRFLTSMAPAGLLSTLYLSQQIYAAAGQVINKAVAAPMVPLLAIQARANDWLGFRRTYRRRLSWMLGLTGVGYLFVLCFGRFLLNLLVGHAHFTAGNVHLLWWTLLALGGSFVGGALGQISSVAFYAMGDTKTPTKLGIWTYSIYVPAKIMIFIHYGLIGLAISISMFVTLNFALQFLRLERFTGRRLALLDKL
jgi:putative peptidoglycan lipid II flippase